MDGPGAAQRRLDPGGDAPDAARPVCAAHRRGRRGLGRAALRFRPVPRLQVAARNRYRKVGLHRCPRGSVRGLGWLGELVVAQACLYVCARRADEFEVRKPLIEHGTIAKEKGC
jgi:hypothetical protein